jgi:hypothetical protein
MLLLLYLSSIFELMQPAWFTRQIGLITKGDNTHTHTHKTLVHNFFSFNDTCDSTYLDNKAVNNATVHTSTTKLSTMFSLGINQCRNSSSENTGARSNCCMYCKRHTAKTNPTENGHVARHHSPNIVKLIANKPDDSHPSSDKWPTTTKLS